MNCGFQLQGVRCLFEELAEVSFFVGFKDCAELLLSREGRFLVTRMGLGNKMSTFLLLVS